MGSAPGQGSRRLLALLPPALTAVTVAWFITSGRWELVGIWAEPSVIGWKTGFADLAYVTATADCLVSGDSLDTCDPYGRPFTPYSILPGSFFALFGVGLQETGIIGVLLAVTWVALIGFLSLWIAMRWQRGGTELVLALVAVTVVGVAPPSLLAIERGTIDIAITACAAIGLLLMVGQSRIPRSVGSVTRQVLAATMLFLAVIVKYFAIGVYAAFLAPRRWKFIPLASAIAAVIFLIANRDDLFIAQEVSKSDVASTTRILFSSTTGIVTLLTADPYAFFPPSDHNLNMALIAALGAIVVAMWTVIFVAALRRGGLITTMPDATWLLVTGGGFIIAIPYFLGNSNDYRLIGLILPLAGVLRWIGEAPHPILWLPIVLILSTMVTGSSMIANEYGFVMPKAVIILGDFALAGVVGFCIAVWVNSFLRKPADSAPASL